MLEKFKRLRGTKTQQAKYWQKLSEKNKGLGKREAARLKEIIEKEKSNP